MTANTITYYAILDENSSLDRPVGVFRRVKSDKARLTRSSRGTCQWEFSPLLYSAERGDMMYDFAEITEDEASKIVARIRAEAAAQAE